MYGFIFPLYSADSMTDCYLKLNMYQSLTLVKSLQNIWDQNKYSFPRRNRKILELQRLKLGLKECNCLRWEIFSQTHSCVHALHVPKALKGFPTAGLLEISCLGTLQSLIQIRYLCKHFVSLNFPEDLGLEDVAYLMDSICYHTMLGSPLSLFCPMVWGIKNTQHSVKSWPH